MDKPLSVRVAEFKTAVENAINESGLPPAVVQPVMQVYMLQIDMMARQQVEADIAKLKEEVTEDGIE